MSTGAGARYTCTTCPGEWTAIFQGTSCPDCGGAIIDNETGSEVERADLPQWDESHESAWDELDSEESEHASNDERATRPAFVDCPRCAEPIRANALVCRFCGVSLDRQGEINASLNGLAVVALITTLLGLCVIGIILGLVANNQIKRSLGLQRGSAVANWAIGLGLVGVVVQIAWVLLVLNAHNNPGAMVWS